MSDNIYNGVWHIGYRIYSENVNKHIDSRQTQHNAEGSGSKKLNALWFDEVDYYNDEKAKCSYLQTNTRAKNDLHFNLPFRQYRKPVIFPETAK